MMRYVISDHVVAVKRRNDLALYNSIRPGSLIIADKEALAFLRKFEKPSGIGKIIKRLKDAEGAEEVAEQFINSGLLIEEGFDEREAIRKRFNDHLALLESGKKLKGIMLEVTKRCNFRCHYCFAQYLSKSGSRNKAADMSIEVAKRSVSLLVDKVADNGGKSFELSFLGGEPLLNFKLIRECINYANELASRYGLTPFYSLTTNGSLATIEIADFLFMHNIKISVSLDGLPHGNDVNRVKADGKGTFSSIVKGIKTLISRGIEVCVLTTLTDNNLPLMDESFIDFLVKLKVRNLGLNLEDIRSMISDDDDFLAGKLISLSSYAQKNGVATAGMWLKPVNSLIAEHHAYCMSAEGAYLSIEPDGKIYSCSRTGNSIGKIDNFHEIFRSRGYLDFGSQILGRRSDCTDCKIEGLCLGGCPASYSLTKNRCSGNRCSLTAKSKKMCGFANSIVKKILSDDESNLLI